MKTPFSSGRMKTGTAGMPTAVSGPCSWMPATAQKGGRRPNFFAKKRIVPTVHIVTSLYISNKPFRSFVSLHKWKPLSPILGLKGNRTIETDETIRMVYLVGEHSELLRQMGCDEIDVSPHQCREKNGHGKYYLQVVGHPALKVLRSDPEAKQQSTAG